MEFLKLGIFFKKSIFFLNTHPTQQTPWLQSPEKPPESSENTSPTDSFLLEKAVSIEPKSLLKLQFISVSYHSLITSKLCRFYRFLGIIWKEEGGGQIKKIKHGNQKRDREREFDITDDYQGTEILGEIRGESLFFLVIRRVRKSRNQKKIFLRKIGKFKIKKRSLLIAKITFDN